MRIVIYVQDLRASGVVRTMLTVARGLAADGLDVTLLAGTSHGVFKSADVAPAKLQILKEVPPKRWPRAAVVPALREALRAIDPDVILSGGNFGHYSLWLAARGLRSKVMFRFSNPFDRDAGPWRNRRRRAWGKLLLKTMDRGILVGESLADDPVFQPALAKGKLVLIPNGIDLARIPPASDEVPQPMQGPDPVILSVGRLNKQKNFEGLIQAAALAAKTRPLRLVILGTGTDAYRKRLQAIAERSGLGDRLHFAGVTADVFPWLRAARVFAMFSHYEGSSIALLEALATDTPIVASRSAGDSVQVLDDGRYGLLVEPGDIEGFAAALLRQLDDPLRPGERVQAYRATAMLAAYRRVLTEESAFRPERLPPAETLASR